jgi:hypothetical protein
VIEYFSPGRIAAKERAKRETLRSSEFIKLMKNFLMALMS